MNLAIPVLPRLKVSIRIASGTQFTSSIQYQIFMEWFGLDLSCEHPDWSEFGQKKMEPCSILA